MVPKVTVLMTVYNGEKYIGEAIESILNQTFTGFEFLIIDDCSTDKTLDIVKKFGDPRIILIQNEKNIGFIKSLNLGIAMSQGEYIARMDADDISLPDRLFEELVFLNNNPDIAMVGTAREEIDESGVKIMNFIPKKDPNFQEICDDNPFQHSSVMIRKSILLEFGGYDDLFPTCEDYALWLLVSKKYKVHNIPKILCKLRLHKESISIKKFEEQTFSQILAVRMVTNQLTDTDKEGIQQFGVKYLKDTLSNDEMNYYLIRAANAYRINNNFYEARKVYRKLFLMNHFDLIAILNYFRLFFGKKFVNETTKIYKIFRNKCMSELDQHQKI